MTKDRVIQLYEASSAGILRPQLAANMLSQVCEVTLELFKIVEQQNAHIKKLESLNRLNHDREQQTT